MGAIQSQPESIKTPDVLDFILQEMFRRADLVDIYSLADPERCNRYIVLAMTALDQLFVKINLYPEKKDGTLYFQSIDGILKGAPPAVRETQRKSCKELAFFFIRVFQTFGALALTIRDSELPKIDPLDSRAVLPDRLKKGVFIQPGEFLGFPQKPQQSRGFFGIGGQITGDKYRSYMFRDGSPYKVLNEILSPQSVNTKAPIKVVKFDTLFLRQDSVYNLTERPSTQNPDQVDITRVLKPEDEIKPIFIYKYTRGTTETIFNGLLTLKQQGNLLRAELSSIQRSDGGDVKLTRPVFEVLNVSEGFPSVSRGEQFANIKGKGLEFVLERLFREVAEQVLGKPPFSVLEFLRKFGYITSSREAGQIQINGTKIRILNGDATGDTLRIRWVGSAPIGADGKQEQVKISATLVIGEPTKKIVSGDEVWNWPVTVDFSNKDVQPDEVAQFFSFPNFKRSDFYSYSLDSAPKSKTKEQTLNLYLEEVFSDIVAGRDETGAVRGLQYTRDGMPIPIDAGIDEDFRVKQIWKALAKDPPVKAHCVARATQLLSVAAIRGPIKEESFSSACRLTFGYQKDGSLPEPGTSIKSESGVYATAILFLDSLNEAGQPVKTDPARYKEFLKGLKFAFEKYESMAAVEADIAKNPVQSLDSIRDKLIPFCDTPEGSDAQLQIPVQLAQSLQTTARQLYAQQAEHVPRVMEIVFKLFDRDMIMNKKRFAFSQSVIQGGMRRVNEIAAEAREFLLKYYMNCEKTYRDGLLKIYQYNQANPNRVKFIRYSTPTSSTSSVPTA